MSNWRKVSLDQLCEKKIETISSKDDFDIDYIDISSIDNDSKKITSFKTVNTKEAPSRAKQIIKKNDILVSTVRPNLNAVALNTLSSQNVVVGSTGYCVLRCKDQIDVNYLFNYCKSKGFISNLVKVAKGASYPAVSNSDVKSSLIPLPPLDIQKKIAKTLDITVGLLNMRKQQLAELDNLIKSIFYEMFGDPVVNEKAWKIGKIKNLASSISYGTSQKATLEKLSFPVLRMNNITYQGNWNLTELKYVDLSDQEQEKYLVYKGDLLFNRTNSKELVGKTAVFREETPMAYAGYLVRLVPNEKGNSEFISTFLNSTYGKKMLFNMAKNIVGMANINAKELGNMDIYIPPFKLQDKFASIVTKIEEQKALVQKAIDETQLLFDSLMSEYFD